MKVFIAMGQLGWEQVGWAIACSGLLRYYLLESDMGAEFGDPVPMNELDRKEQLQVLTLFHGCSGGQTKLDMLVPPLLLNSRNIGY